MESVKKNKILLMIFILTTVFFVYFFFFGGSNTTSSVLEDLSVSESTVSSDVIHKLNQLNSVQIDQSLFTGAVWMSLQDMSTPLPNDTAGKNDPFSPLGNR